MCACVDTVLRKEKKRHLVSFSFLGVFLVGGVLFWGLFFSWTLNDSINSILPHLYRDPASASPDGSVSLFLMNDSKTTGCGESRENRKSRFFSLQIEFNNRKDKQFLWLVQMSWLIYNNKKENRKHYELRLFSSYCFRNTQKGWNWNIR